MSEFSVNDVLLFSVIALMSAAMIGFTGAVDLPGSNSGNLVCSVPVVSGWTGSCGTEVVETYDVSTEVMVTGTAVDLVFDGFSYETEKSSLFSSFSFIKPSSNLAFGTDNLRVNYQLVTEEGELVADGSKWVGSLEALESQTVRFDTDNVEKGRYTVKYEAVYNPDFEFFTGAEQVKTFEENIRVPRRIE